MTRRGLVRLVAGAVAGFTVVAVAGPAEAVTHAAAHAGARAGSHSAHRAAVSAVTVPGGFVPTGPTRILDTRTGLGAPNSVVASHGSVTLTVAGAGGVPASGVGAVVVNVTAADDTGTGYITVFPTGAARPATSSLNLTPPHSVANLVTVPLGTGGAITLYNGSTKTTDLIADVAGYYLAGAPVDAGAFAPLTPSRILDTRIGKGAAKAKVAGHATLLLKVTGAGGIPASAVGAVVVNLTVTTGTKNGFLTAYPAGSALPTASNVNFPAATSVPNLVTVGVGSGGKVALYNGSTGSVNLIADVEGYYRSGAASKAGTFVPVAPTRFLDSRIDKGFDSSPVFGHNPGSVQVLATGAVPVANVGATVVNLTATAATGSGYLTAYPMGTDRPTASNLNFVGGITRANAAILAPGGCGQLTLYNGQSASAQAQFVGDVSGYFLAADATAPVTPTNTVRAWGDSDFGALGNGTFTGTTSPVTALGVSGITAISAQGGSVLALRSDQTVTGWGPNLYGELGIPPFSEDDQGHWGCALSVDTPGLTGVTAISTGGVASYALRTDGTVWAWGNNEQSQLGDGTQDPHYTPAQVAGITDVTAIDAGESDLLALKSDGTVWGWGSEFSGELGGGDDTVGVPTQIAGLSGVAAIAEGDGVSYALKTNGTVWAWGSNAYGALGNGTAPDQVAHPTPTQVSGLTTVTAIDAGLGSTGALALLADGTVRSWGINERGELGDGSDPNTHFEALSPVTVTGLSGVTAISAEGWNSMALKSDGTVWAWGATPGNGTTVDKHSPYQVAGISGATAITAGQDNALVVVP